MKRWCDSFQTMQKTDRSIHSMSRWRSVRLLQVWLLWILWNKNIQIQIMVFLKVNGNSDVFDRSDLHRIGSKNFLEWRVICSYQNYNNYKILSSHDKFGSWLGWMFYYSNAWYNMHINSLWASTVFRHNNKTRL